MPQYRYQVVDVGLWRGKVKRWNTTYHVGDSSSTPFIKGFHQALGWKQAGDVVGACSGGVASITIYNASGGAPIASTVYFDWKTPSTWIPYTGTAWSGVPAATPLDASGESALVILGRLPNLSTKGKPIFTRKYFHAIPSRTATTYTDPDIAPAVLASLAGVISPSYMGNKAGVTPSVVTASQWYLNHQRVRGRRRTTKQVAAGSFSAGVIAGSGVAPSGAASPQ